MRKESSRPDAKIVANSATATSGKSTHFLLSWSAENSDVVKSDATMLRPRQFDILILVFRIWVITFDLLSISTFFSTI